MKLTYPDELPITARKDEIVAAIGGAQVVIVAGETGSGKSTQLPKMCLELGRGLSRAEGGAVVGHTQPRRIAARTLAERIAAETGTSVGDEVGYQVRFTDQVSARTRLKLMTDGILLAELQRDRLLRRYDTLIVDEAHERGLNIDFILGYLAQLLPQRPDLKVIVTSATIDTERFSAHFDDAPIVEVSGRSHPVEVRYRPLVGEDEDGVIDRDQTQAICDAIEELTHDGRGQGDVLVFLSGEREIRDTADAITRLQLPNTEVLPLYARLSSAEQHRVFQPHAARRVVLATNVAETSLTVPGVRYVVDPGTARISRYSRRTKVQRLPIERVSQASANQRAGRCGRVAPGICIRLYSEEDFAARPEYTEPEILRTNLASVILQMTAIGLGDVAAFPFLDPPDARNVKDGVLLLEELGALDGQRLTRIGRQLAQLPLDPRLGRMVIAGGANGCVREIMVIAAALAIQDPRERPSEKQAQADEMHARFADKDSDFVSLLNLWAYVREQQQTLSGNQFRKLCRTEFLNYLRVREWQDVHSQLRQVARTLGITPNTTPGDRDQIHRSLLTGLLSHLGMKDATRNEYRGARDARFAIAPGSALAKRQPAWIMAAELVETNRMWARVVSRVQPEWAERAGAHLVKRSYGEPSWDATRGVAMTNERVTLYGLPIVASRRVQFSKVDAREARDLFLWHALVEGEWRTHHAFFAANQDVVEEARELERRARRRDLVVDEQRLFDFYDERVPADITSARHFDRWWNSVRGEQPELLTLHVDDLVDASAGSVDADAFPDHWRHGDIDLALTYELDHGTAHDGVTVHIPLAVLNRIDGSGFDWQVPGLREELVTAVVRSLPKPVRRNFVPVPDYVAAFLDRASPADGPLVDVLARELTRMTGDSIPPGSWQLDRVPGHLRMNFRVVGDDGEVVATGKDLDAIRRKLHAEVRAAISGATSAGAGPERERLTAWTIDEVPRVVEVVRAGQRVQAFPALVDEGDAVTLQMFASEHEQATAMRAGLRRLLLLTAGPPRSVLDRLLSNSTKLAVARLAGASAADVIADCVAAAVDDLVDRNGGAAWTAAAFESLREAVRGDVIDLAVDVATAAGRLIDAAGAIERRLDSLTTPALVAAVADVRVQVSRLVHLGFVSEAGVARLPHLARYLDAVERRLDRLVAQPGRDATAMRVVQQLEDEYADLVGALAAAGRDPHDADEARWMIEELRVSLFAQSVGTAGPVSEQRVVREMDRVAAGE